VTPDRIKAAARAILAAVPSGYGMTPAEAAAYSERGVAAAYPELAAGTHWLAPMEVTEGMIEAGQMEARWEDRWQAMRDAYLNTNPNRSVG
jgi:hypothetical protein